MKSTITVLLLVVLSLGVASCSTMEKEKSMMEKEAMMEEMEYSYMDVSAMEAYKMLMDNPEIFVIDVSPLYDQGHLPGAISAPLGDGTLDELIPTWNMEGTYLVYCHADEPSMMGAQKLVDAGFMNVYRLQGNYAAWVEAGYPVE